MENSYLVVLPGLWKDGVTIVAVITPTGEQSPHTYIMSLSDRVYCDYFLTPDILDRQMMCYNIVPDLLTYVPANIPITHVLLLVAKTNGRGMYLCDNVNPLTCRIERCELHYVFDFFLERDLRVSGYPYARSVGA